MVKLHRPTVPRAITVKKARPRRHDPPAACVVCGALLRSDHASDLVCDCHPREGFNPRAVAPQELDERVVLLLLRARGRPLLLYRALGCEPTKTNLRAIDEAVRRINASRMLRVVGCGSAGRKLGELWRVQRRRVGA